MNAAKEFFISLGENSIYKRLLKEPWTYAAGAVMLSLFQIVHLAALGGGWGITGAFANWGAWALQLFGAHPEQWAYFATDSARATLANGFWADGGTLRNLGVIFGALLATLFASQFKLKKIKALRQVVAAVLGGLLMGYGARLAGGCNIGALFTAIASLSLSGWVFAVFLLLGAWIGSRLLVKYFT